MRMTTDSLGRVIIIVAWSFGVSRRLNVMRLGPGPPLGRAEAATMFPTLLGRRTAACVILAGKGSSVIFDMSGRQGNAKASHDERRESKPGPELSP
jgi:hypothetical protein